MTEEQAAGRPVQEMMQEAFASTVEADTVDMESSGAALIVATDTVNMNQSGAAAIVSDGEAKLVQSGSAFVMSNEADLTQSFVGVLASREVTLGPDTKVLATWVEALIFGAAFGLVAAVADILFRGYCRRR